MLRRQIPNILQSSLFNAVVYPGGYHSMGNSSPAISGWEGLCLALSGYIALLPKLLQSFTDYFFILCNGKSLPLEGKLSHLLL